METAVELPAEPWANRIKERMQELGETQTSLARACRISQPSVSQWFNPKQGKRTSEISGKNLLAVAKFLRTTPDWIITGRGPRDLSQPVELDLAMLQSAIVSVKEALRAEGLELDAFLAAPMIAFAYRERVRYPREMTSGEYDGFDAMVRSRLTGELGKNGQERPVAAGSQGRAQGAAGEAAPRRAAR